MAVVVPASALGTCLVRMGMGDGGGGDGGNDVDAQRHYSPDGLREMDGCMGVIVSVQLLLVESPNSVLSLQPCG